MNQRATPEEIDTPAEPAQRGRARKYAQVMEQIHASAIQVFAREGPAGATTQAIADGAGLSKAQLHYYIDTKDALYRDVIQDILDEWVAVFGFKDEALGPRKVLGDYIRRKMRFSLDEPLRSRIFAAEMMRGGPVALALMDNSQRRTAQAVSVIRSWIQQGLMAAVDPMPFLFHIWAVTQFYADHAEQVHMFMPGQLKSATGREHLIEQVIDQVFRVAGLRRE